jgi:HlyD family secretion protein
MKKNLKTAIIALFLVGLSVAGYAYYKTKTKLTPEDVYRTELITQGDVSQSVSANGTINPVTLVSVGTQVSGIVTKLYVDFNDKVTKGQVLLELDDSLLKAQIAQSQANVSNAQASVDLAQANEARNRSLYAQDFVAKQDLDTTVQAFKSARAQLDVARAQLKRDQTNLGYSIIRSPVSGVVVDREIDVGQTVASSYQTPMLIKIAQDLSKMQIDTTFAEADIGNIKVGQAAKFNVDAFPDRNFEGVVKQVRLNATTTSNVVTYDVVVNVDNPDQTLLPGMTAYVNIIFAQHKNVLLVPNAALRYKPKLEVTTRKNGHKKDKSDQDKNKSTADVGFTKGKVFVLKEGKPQLVKVRAGLTDGKSTEVVSKELSADSMVIVGENTSDTQASSSSANMRPPRMF